MSSNSIGEQHGIGRKAPKGRSKKGTRRSNARATAHAAARPVATDCAPMARRPQLVIPLRLHMLLYLVPALLDNFVLLHLSRTGKLLLLHCVSWCTACLLGSTPACRMHLSIVCSAFSVALSSFACVLHSIVASAGVPSLPSLPQAAAASSRYSTGLGNLTSRIMGLPEIMCNAADGDSYMMSTGCASIAAACESVVRHWVVAGTSSKARAASEHEPLGIPWHPAVLHCLLNQQPACKLMQRACRSLTIIDKRANRAASPAKADRPFPSLFAPLLPHRRTVQQTMWRKHAGVTYEEVQSVIKGRPMPKGASHQGHGHQGHLRLAPSGSVGTNADGSPRLPHIGRQRCVGEDF